MTRAKVCDIQFFNAVLEWHGCRHMKLSAQSVDYRLPYTQVLYYTPSSAQHNTQETVLVTEQRCFMYMFIRYEGK